MLSSISNENNLSFEELFKLAQDLEIGTDNIQQNQIKSYEIYCKLADLGYHPAQYSLGNLYLRNKFSPLYDQNYGTESILPSLIALFKEAYILEEEVNLNTILDQIFNSKFYVKTESLQEKKIIELNINSILSRIFKCNLYHAKKLFTLSAEQGNVDALFALGEIYLNESFGMQDIEKARRFFMQAMAKGHILAKCRLGEICDAYDKNKTEAIKLYKEAAKQNCSTAIYNLAIRYDLGIDMKENRELATLMYLKASELNHPAAQYMLSDRYIMGEYVVKNASKSVALCLNAADQGYPPAQNIMGLRFANGGDGMVVNVPKAIKWFRKGAANFDKESFFNLGTIYHLGGGGINVDLELAIKYYQKAALLGHVGAKNNLAVIFQLLYHEVLNSNNDLNERLADRYLRQKNYWEPTEEEKVNFALLRKKIAEDRRKFLQKDDEDGKAYLKQENCYYNLYRINKNNLTKKEKNQKKPKEFNSLIIASP